MNYYSINRDIRRVQKTASRNLYIPNSFSKQSSSTAILSNIDLIFTIKFNGVNRSFLLFLSTVSVLVLVACRLKPVVFHTAVAKTADHSSLTCADRRVGPRQIVPVFPFA